MWFSLSQREHLFFRPDLDKIGSHSVLCYRMQWHNQVRKMIITMKYVSLLIMYELTTLRCH